MPGIVVGQMRPVRTDANGTAIETAVQVAQESTGQLMPGCHGNNGRRWYDVLMIVYKMVLLQYGRKERGVRDEV